MNKALMITSIIIVLVAIGMGGWFWCTASQSQNNTDLMQKNVEVKNESQQREKQASNSQKSNVESQKSVEQEIEDVDTSNWKTYQNEEFGFEMKYLEGWEIEEANNLHPSPLYEECELLFNIVPVDRPINYKLFFDLSAHNTTQSPREWYINHMENPEYSEYQGTYKNMKINNLETYYVYEDKGYKSMNYVIKINENTILFIRFRPASSNIPYDFTEYIPQYQNFIQSIKTIK